MVFEIHTEDEVIPGIEAPDAYEAAIQYAARYAPCSIRRVRPERPGDAFVVTATGSQVGGFEVEVFEHDPTAEPWV